ncbi:exosortase family protein XrtF [Lacinutrix sp. Bg11-31]|uniref:exosortase family protein XrtF n=1 Tax=Lacinutrix sp. Bg11-31 TaxID=2057808 RepID=UPI000C300AA5|nr:exosortase family protein XrtF [Lacinutrix sp. Bg11-31]AUC83466.1 exosortase family protein XrtF [Lacinutrix sp. Bg11-31]
MKALFIKYKSVLKFILTFLLVYIGLSVIYKLYLNASVGSQYYPDYVTNLVAYQSEALLNTIGYSTEVVKHPHEPSMKLLVRGKYIARIIEGCNAISVIVLFISFVISFSGKFKSTVLFLLSGSVLIYVVNLIRIVILSVGLYHYPWRSEILHTVVFPAIIYGMVFLLWMLWVNRFSNIGKKNG